MRAHDYDHGGPVPTAGRHERELPSVAAKQLRAERMCMKWPKGCIPTGGTARLQLPAPQSVGRGQNGNHKPDACIGSRLHAERVSYIPRPTANFHASRTAVGACVHVLLNASADSLACTHHPAYAPMLTPCDVAADAPSFHFQYQQLVQHTGRQGGHGQAHASRFLAAGSGLTTMPPPPPGTRTALKLSSRARRQ